MSGTTRTTHDIAYDRAGPRGGTTVVLVHAGVADRRMWEPQWPGLTARHDTVRLDLRGFGDSDVRPERLDPVADLLATLDELGVARAHLVGASYGAGVVLETALVRPGLVASLTLLAPGGALLAEMTPDLRAFLDAERAALAADDLDAAVEANLDAWVDGPHRSADAVLEVRAAVTPMQRRAFEVSVDWDDVTEAELDPPALERYAEVVAPTLVLLGALDLETVHDAARRVAEGVPGARPVTWPDVAHLPSLERPADTLTLLEEWWS